MKCKIRLKGGPGSGNRGHAGRPGKVGGSSSAGGGANKVRGVNSYGVDLDKVVRGSNVLYTWGRSGHDYKGGTVISVEDSDYGASFKVTLGLHIPGTKPYVVEVPDWKIRRLTGSVDDISDIPEDVPFDLRPHLTGL